jgi:two-component system, OmpR family, sensor kinase
VSLRRRLVVGMLLLLIAAIVTTDLVTSSHLSSFLTGRLDEQMDVAQRRAYSYIYDTTQRAVANGNTLAVSNPQAWLAQLTTAGDASCTQTASPPTRVPSGTSATPSGGGVSGRAAGEAPGTRLNGSALAARDDPDVYVEVITNSGTVAFRDPSGSCTRPDPAPKLPRNLPVQATPLSHVFGGKHGVYVPDPSSFEVGAVGAPGSQYRAEAVAVPGGTMVTAISLDPTNQTLASLTNIEIVVSIVVILALLVLVLWIVRFGLSPLYDMTKTARAISEGDFTRRIKSTDERSEVGRLGSALNGMLSQIEAAFGERAASESRLRRFVADASHELRTPLTSIRGYAELLRKGALTDEDAKRRASERIEGEAERMSLLVDDLLLLARLDQGRPFEQAPLLVGDIVREAVDAARTVDPSRPITLDLKSAVIVQGDAARLRQVVDNLLRNAEVHTPPGTPVHVEVTRRASLAVVSVRDEGPGMDEEEQERVFDRFYRGNEARTGGGAGLGLSIVAAIAAAHGGRARVESSPGNGSTFTVELPAQLPDLKQTAEPSRTVERNGSVDQSRAGAGKITDEDPERARSGDARVTAEDEATRAFERAGRSGRS